MSREPIGLDEMVARRDVSFNRSGRGSTLPKYHRVAGSMFMAGCNPKNLLLNDDTARSERTVPDASLCRRAGCFKGRP